MARYEACTCESTWSNGENEHVEQWERAQNEQDESHGEMNGQERCARNEKQDPIDSHCRQ